MSASVVTFRIHKGNAEGRGRFRLAHEDVIDELQELVASRNKAVNGARWGRSGRVDDQLDLAVALAHHQHLAVELDVFHAVEPGQLRLGVM